MLGNQMEKIAIAAIKMAINIKLLRIVFDFTLLFIILLLTLRFSPSRIYYSRLYSQGKETRKTRFLKLFDMFPEDAERLFQVGGFHKLLRLDIHLF